MAAIFARANEMIDLRSSGNSWGRTARVFESGALEVIRLELPTGKHLPPHAAPGDVLIHCLEGKLTLTALGRTQELCAGQLVYLPAHESHSVTAIDNAVLLLSIVTNRTDRSNGGDPVDEASRESFPASDPSSHSPVVGS